MPRGVLSDQVEASTLWLVSPLVREVMASVAGEDKVILLPDCDKEDVTRGLALLRESGEDTLVFSAGVRGFLQAVGMDVSRSEVWDKCTDTEECDTYELSENVLEKTEDENIEDKQNAVYEVIDMTDDTSDTEALLQSVENDAVA